MGYVSLATENAEERTRSRIVSMKSCKLFVIIFYIKPTLLRPFHLKCEMDVILPGLKINSLTITDGGLVEAGTLDLTVCRISSRHEYSENRFIQYIFAEGVVHLAGGEIADISRQPAFDAIQHIGRILYSFRGLHCLYASTLHIN